MSATSGHVAIAMDSLQCPVCFGIFPSTPLVLQCGHSFCRGCVKKLKTFEARKNADVAGFACPICRKVTPSELQLTKNYAFKAILEAANRELRAQRKAPNEIVNAMVGVVAFLAVCVLFEAVLLVLLWLRSA